MLPVDPQESRIKTLVTKDFSGKCVLYVMSRDQRVQDNYALLAAQNHALAKKLPLAVVFCLQNKTGHRAREHYYFMLQGLYEVEATLAKLHIPLMMLIGDPKEKLLAVMHHTAPEAIYFDLSPLRGPRNLQAYIAKKALCSVFVVDTHNVVPLWVTSCKQEFAAYTIRPKIHKLISSYLDEPKQIIRHPYAWPGVIKTLNDLQDFINEVLQNTKANNTKIAYVAGETAAHAQLEDFINTKLAAYSTLKNNPNLQAQSNLSPYLHFGHISSLRVTLRLQEESVKIGNELHITLSPKMPSAEAGDSTLQQSIDALLEEMVVRKELADNFCYYDNNYDNLLSAPQWALTTLNKHKGDIREYIYTYQQLENAQTHDDAWNDAQKLLISTGKMHGYMRMYWAKKVLEWTESPQQAIKYLVRLNDFYSIDGGDPNGYAGILWSVAGVHDRPWNERNIFGTIRYMNREGLRRKFKL